MCRNCDYYGTWLSNCLNGRGPTPSPPRGGSSGYDMPQYTVTQQPARQTTPSVRPSSGGGSSVYPGSNFAPTPSRGSGGSSTASASSTISVESARSSVDSIQSDHNIVAVANKINQDIGESEGTVRQLNTWFSALDRHNYKKRNPWTPGMERAYDRYKDLAGRHGEAHTAFADYLQQTRRNATPEQHVRRADLAIAWGKAAIKAAEARLAFMKTYRDAYRLEGIQTHIDEASAQIASARNAVAEARRNYDSIWVSSSRGTNPDVFR